MSYLKTFLCCVIWIYSIAACATIKAIVGIAPLQYAVERVGGNLVEVTPLVSSSQDPETYEPTPKQLKIISHADFYYEMGLPFEEILLAKIKKYNPSLHVVDLRKRVKFRDLEGAPDPHIWTSPLVFQQMADKIYQSLVTFDPADKPVFNKNYSALTHDLMELNKNIHALLDTMPNKHVLVFHPAWGYFFDNYGLTQLAIETEGKERGPQDFAKTLDAIKTAKIKTIFIQPQFSKTQAEAVARQLNLKVAVIDPFAHDYIANLLLVAKTIKANNC
jgi:zinc transport system substrate-binding protein